MQKRVEIIDKESQRLLRVFNSINCQNVWSKAKEGDFTTRKFDIGYFNDVICCKMTEDARKRLCTKKTDCSAVVVKFLSHSECHNQRFKHEPWERAVIDSFISNHDLCPRLLYISDNCQVNEYIESRIMNAEDGCDVEMEKQLARMLARFHSLKPPISNTSTEEYNQNLLNLNNLDKSRSVQDKFYLRLIMNNPYLKDEYLSTLQKIELPLWFKESQKVMRKSNSPIVFSHGDFNRANRLVQTTKDESGNTHKRIYFVDFEYCSYNHRGFDLARYFTTFKHCYNTPDTMKVFPPNEEMLTFLNEYRNEFARLTSPEYLDDPINSVEQLIRETQIFSLYTYASDICFYLQMFIRNPDNDRTEVYLKYIAQRELHYKDLKQRMIDLGFFKANYE